MSASAKQMREQGSGEPRVSSSPLIEPRIAACLERTRVSFLALSADLMLSIQVIVSLKN